MGFQNTGYIYCGAPPAGHGGLLYKSSRNVLGPRGACSPVGKNISDDNRYEHGAVRSTARMRMPVSGTEAAKQRSDAGTYTVS